MSNEAKGNGDLGKKTAEKLAQLDMPRALHEDNQVDSIETIINVLEDIAISLRIISINGAIEKSDLGYEVTQSVIKERDGLLEDNARLENTEDEDQL